VVSSKGQTSEFITSYQLGYWISPKDPYADLLSCLGNLQAASNEQPRSSFDISSYSVKSLTKNLIEIIDDDNYCKVP
jgi:hypothetical protein